MTNHQTPSNQKSKNQEPSRCFADLSLASRAGRGVSFLLSARRGFALTMLFVLLALAATLPASASEKGAPEGTQPAQWRVIWKKDPATQATLSWSTAQRGKTHRVHLSEEGKEETQVVECQRSGQYTKNDGDPNLFFHHTRLTGLKPSTKYQVVMESDGKRSPEMFFITAPSDDRPFSILFGSDSRSGRKERRQMNQMMGRMLGERPTILALAHGGDFVLDGAILKQFSKWMTDHELTNTKDGRLLPIIPTRGNHDRSGLFNQVFDFPDGDLNYYSTTLSPLMRIITLNSNISVAGDQADWLDAELATARPAATWLLTQYHRPAFPAVKEPGGARTSWTPLFEKHNVDMACEADGHAIKRTVPIRDESVDPTGVVYVGEGGLGVGQRQPKSKRWYLQAPGMSGMGHHVQLISFDNEKLVYRAILLGGKEVDRYVRLPRRKKSPKANAKNRSAAAGN